MSMGNRHQSEGKDTPQWRPRYENLGAEKPLTDAQVASIREIIDAKYRVEGDLLTRYQRNIKLKDPLQG